MLHTGSRGLGHQIATDYIEIMNRKLSQAGTVLVDRQLSCAPVGSEEGKRYFSAMAAGANFAWANRQVITNGVRAAFGEVFDGGHELAVVYDIAHNMAKEEVHRSEGTSKRLLVHRKGATRAFPAGREEVPAAYREFGQPVLIPATWARRATSSWVFRPRWNVPSDRPAMGPAVLSRHASVRRFRFDEVTRDLLERGILVKSATKEGVTEEAPGAYKNIEEVVRSAEGAGLTRRVARLVPLGVIKG